MTQNRKNRIQKLIRKYLDRTSTMQERNELVELIKDTSDPEIVDKLWKEVWASTLSASDPKQLTWEDLQKQAADFKKREKLLVRKRAFRWSAAAAAVALAIVFFMTGDWFGNADGFIVYETDYGERKEIELDDGTLVSLNADSRLTWNKNWRKNGMRQIDLEGEAFFDVAKVDFSGKIKIAGDTISRMPFEVQTSDVTIHVLGTSFNAAQRRGQTEVFLEEGVVELSLHRKDDRTPEAAGQEKMENENNLTSDRSDETPEKKIDIIRMQPGELVSYSSDGDQLMQKMMDNSKRLYEWKEGVLSYQDERLGTMLENLEDIYGLNLEIKDTVLIEKRINFSIPYEDWDTVRKMVEVMLKVEITESEDDRYRIQ